MIRLLSEILLAFVIVKSDRLNTSKVYMRKVVSTVRELLQEEDVENIRPTLVSQDQPRETAETDRNSQPRNRGISGSGCN